MTKSPLNSRVQAVWRRSQNLHLIAGLMAFCRWGAGLFLGFVLIDIMFNLPSILRAVLLLVWIAITFHKAWHQGWCHCRRYNAAHTALQIEEHFGNLNSLLVTAIQFQESGSSVGSDSLKDLTCRRAEESISPLPVGDTVKFKVLGQPVVWILLFAVVFSVFASVNATDLRVGFNRFFKPWTMEIYPTDTKINFEKGDIVVKEGDGLNLVATLSGIVPDKAELALKTGQGEPRIHVLNVKDKTCNYSIKTTHRSFEYQIVAGDAESAWHKVTVISAPRIIQVNNNLKFPAYTLKEDQTLETLTFTVPEGSHVTWQFKLDRAIKEGQFTCKGEEPKKLKVSADGLSVSVSYQANSSNAYRFSWIEKKHGYDFKSPRHYIQVMPDEAPTLELAKPKRNLMATLKRQLDLAMTARDDHGIAKAEILYRVNESEESRLKFPLTKSKQGFRQHYDWKYHQNIKDLKVGDKISFAVEVSDRYPGPNGAYKTRSDRKTITFLSEKDYLKHVSKIKFRLLRQLRGLYRQERQAYSAVDSFDSNDDNFQQSVTLEGMRQDIISERLLHIANEMAQIIEDLKANQIADEQQKKELQQLIAAMKAIADQHIQSASLALRDLADPANKNAAVHSKALRHINKASREIASIVLGLGVDFSREVFSRELAATIQDQATLRLEALNYKASDKTILTAMSTRQKDLSQWITRLLGEMNKNQSYVDRPLLSMRLSLVVNDLKRKGVTRLMDESADLLNKEQMTVVVKTHLKVINILSLAHYKIQPAAESADLLRARDLLHIAGNMQKEIRDQKISDADSLAKKQMSLVNKLRSLRIPYLPAEHTMLIDPEPKMVPDLKALLSNMRSSIMKAQSDKGLQEAEQHIRVLSKLVDQRVSEKMQYGQYYNMYLSAIGRASVIENLYLRQIGILEKVEDAEADEESCVAQSAAQQSLIKEVKILGRSIERNQKRAKNPSKYELKVLSAFDRASSSMEKALKKIKANDAKAAIELQEDVLAALNVAKDVSSQEEKSLEGLVIMIGLANDTKVPRGYLADIVSVQKNLIETTAKIEKDKAGLLVPTQNRLRLAVDEITSLFTGLEFEEYEEPFSVASSALGAAVWQLGEKNLKGAQKEQKLSMRLVDKLRQDFKNAEMTNDFLSDVMEYVHQQLSDNVEIEHLQKRLMSEINSHADKGLESFVSKQKLLFEKAKSYGSALKAGTGKERYLLASSHMKKILEYMAENNRPMVLSESILALRAFDKDREVLLDKLVHLALIPGLDELEASYEVTTLLDTLAVGARQNELCLKMWAASNEEKKVLGKTQLSFKKDLKDLVEMSDKHASIIKAQSLVIKAVESIENSSWKEAYKNQRESGRALLQFVLQTCHEVPFPMNFGPRPLTLIESANATVLLEQDESFKIFAKMYSQGSLAKDKRSEWEVLGSRDRAALNENFARELPLEYRELLKNYYERLAK